MWKLKINKGMNKIRGILDWIIELWFSLLLVIKDVLRNLKGLCVSLRTMSCSIREIRSFYGYHHLFFAKRYAKRRHDQWKHYWDGRGKHQGIFPYKDESIIVLSSLEIRYLKRRGMINNDKFYRKFWKKNNYWNTVTGLK